MTISQTKTRTILFSDHSYRTTEIFTQLRDLMPDADLRLYPEIGNAAEIDYAIVWQPQPGSLQNLPNLKAIFSIGAGVDGILRDDTIPNVPLIRNSDDSLAHDVSGYVVYEVLRLHRSFAAFETQQPQKSWKRFQPPAPHERRIGLMGVGKMAAPAIHALTALGFAVQGWSRTPKIIPGVQSFAGTAQFHAFLQQTDILVNLLPLTPETTGILNRALFAQLPQGAMLINTARGAHMVEEDLLAALDSGQLSHAALDVFVTEPLPADNPLWLHPKISITPHVAAITRYDALCRHVIQHITAFENGEPLQDIVDRVSGY